MESASVLTIEEKMAVKKVERSVKFIEGRYQVAIPWRDNLNKLSLSDNYKMAFQRLQNIESVLQEIRKLLQPMVRLLRNTLIKVM